jgi:hypothetical protein
MPDVKSRIRSEIGQLSWALREYRRPQRWVEQWRSNRGITLPDLPEPSQRDEVWGIAMVRDEVDIIGLTVQHLLDQGLDHVLVVDNRSRDATPRILAELSARDPRLHVGRDDEPRYYQAEKMSYLAHIARQRGARWVVPFDADEFWFAKDELLADLLRRQDTATVVHAAWHSMVPSGDGPIDVETEYVLDATPTFPGKVAARTHPWLVLGVGNHSAARVGAHAHGIHIAHAVYRSPSQVARKVRQGAAAAVAAGKSGNIAPHWRRASGLDDDAIADIWSDLRTGRPVPLLDHQAAGPMVSVRPGVWSTWDPADLLAG